MDQQTLRIILPQELLAQTLQMKNDGYRLVAITCTNKNGMELTYTFDRDYRIVHLRFTIDAAQEIESISSFYSFAFLYENEIKELFGVAIKNISVDFNNHLYKISVATPFNPKKENV